MKRTRGRPRKYDEGEALNAAIQVFWQKGYSDTSLDDLAESMKMNRPSIYRAFGDKEAVFKKAMAKFACMMDAAFEQSMQSDEEMGVKLERFCLSALDIYTRARPYTGCMIMSAAVAVAPSHTAIQEDLLGFIHHIDTKLAEQFRLSAEEGKLSVSVSPESRASLAQSLIHSLSLRARAGETREKLHELIKASVKVIVI
ncbi:TetR/AcrR family transcriptional regulator [Agarilytica rhodophyticola]|uniref:TetR/AcrR family transcriptional regulator n=1 Tax=Agarilytica rhodophyticola TaxID=1737490 RepID=UPI000B347A6F|nr:TetR/AcrR family transcriptional regulator [Agarilytica rhodophyticola]